MEHETCGRCGRKLKTEKSKLEGYGPVCLKKVEEEREHKCLGCRGYVEGGGLCEDCMIKETEMLEEMGAI